MPAQESGSTSGEDRALSAKVVIGRLQELVNARPTGSAIPLEWAVSAYFLGDVNGLACLSLRSND